MGYNWSRAIRKGITSAVISAIPKLIEIQRVPNIDELWVAFLIGLLAFALSIQKEEEVAPKEELGNTGITQRLDYYRKKFAEEYLI